MRRGKQLCFLRLRRLLFRLSAGDETILYFLLENTTGFLGSRVALIYMPFLVIRWLSGLLLCSQRFLHHLSCMQIYVLLCDEYVCPCVCVHVCMYVFPQDLTQPAPFSSTFVTPSVHHHLCLLKFITSETECFMCHCVWRNVCMCVSLRVNIHLQCIISVTYKDDGNRVVLFIA